MMPFSSAPPVTLMLSMSFPEPKPQIRGLPKNSYLRGAIYTQLMALARQVIGAVLPMAQAVATQRQV
jgi:hypothetical protein